jgi:hypothetical protein
VTNTPPLGGGGPRPVLSQGITLIVQPAQCNAWVGLDLEGPEWTSQAFVKIFFQVPLGKSLKALPEALACPCCGHCLTSPYSWVIENLEGRSNGRVKFCYILSKDQWGTARGLPEMSECSVFW